MNVSEHIAEAEAWVRAAATDSGLTEDEVFSDVVYSYIECEVQPELRAEVRRALGVQSRG
jgi:hypothetical protein